MTSKEIAKEIRENLKKEFPALKFSVSKDDFSMGSSIYVYLMEGNFEPFTIPNQGYSQVNHFHIEKSSYLSDEAKKVLVKVLEIMRKRHYDHSDAMTDYFDTNFYIHLSIGKWDRPYINRGGK